MIKAIARKVYGTIFWKWLQYGWESLHWHEKAFMRWYHMGRNITNNFVLPLSAKQRIQEQVENALQGRCSVDENLPRNASIKSVTIITRYNMDVMRRMRAVIVPKFMENQVVENTVNSVVTNIEIGMVNDREQWYNDGIQSIVTHPEVVHAKLETVEDITKINAAYDKAFRAAMNESNLMRLPISKKTLIMSAKDSKNERVLYNMHTSKSHDILGCFDDGYAVALPDRYTVHREFDEKHEKIVVHVIGWIAGNVTRPDNFIVCKYNKGDK